jgi:hypothetical protein
VSPRTPHVYRVNPLSNSRSWYPRSGPDPLELGPIPSPSEGNATAKQGYQRRAPIACSLLPSACTLTHAFACCPTRTQRISHRHRSSIIARHRVPVGGLRHRGRLSAQRTNSAKKPKQRTSQQAAIWPRLRALRRHFRNGRYHRFDAQLPWRQQFRGRVAKFRPVKRLVRPEIITIRRPGPRD